MIVLGEQQLRRILHSYFEYYHRSRTYLSLAKDAPDERAIQSAEMGEVIKIAEVRGAAPPVRAKSSLMKAVEHALNLILAKDRQIKRVAKGDG